MYTAIEDVERLIAQFVLGDSTKPDITQSQSIISDTEYEVNTYLSAKGVDIPVASPSYFVEWLGLLCSYGSAAAILKSMFPSATGAAETPAYAFWEARYKAGLKGIMDGTLIPSDMIPAKQIRPSTYFTRNPDSNEPLGTIAEPWFERSHNW